MADRCEKCRHAVHRGECLAPTLTIDKEANVQIQSTCACGANAAERAMRRRVQRAAARHGVDRDRRSARRG